MNRFHHEEGEFNAERALVDIWCAHAQGLLDWDKVHAIAMSLDPQRVAGTTSRRRGIVLGEIVEERARQDEKWGLDDRHPNVPPELASPTTAAAALGIPTAGAAKAAVDQAATEGRAHWAGILIEEVAEAVEAAVLGDEESLRKELIQVAATAMKWIERAL